ncbi:hypothetical protein [Parafrankia sp. BMG5.11]|uniref:hypothetical protein n=1 Tax=Parafrankia sp. BMG5.11 TaxID=222540 RepID=UPI0035A0E5AD
MAYANERVQFGKLVGRQQAVQQLLAVVAEDAVAARMAVELACEGGGTIFRAATAKSVASVASAAAARLRTLLMRCTAHRHQRGARSPALYAPALRVANGRRIRVTAQPHGQAVLASDSSSTAGSAPTRFRMLNAKKGGRCKAPAPFFQMSLVAYLRALRSVSMSASALSVMKSGA